jgi:hypothetical protein
MAHSLEYLKKLLAEEKEWVEEMIYKEFTPNRMREEIRKKHDFKIDQHLMKRYILEVFNKEYVDKEWLEVNGEPRNQKRHYKKRTKVNNKENIDDDTKEVAPRIKKPRKRIARDSKWGVFIPNVSFNDFKNRSQVEAENNNQCSSITENDQKVTHNNINEALKPNSGDFLECEDLYFNNDSSKKEDNHLNVLKTILKRLYYLEKETKQIKELQNDFIQDYKSLENDLYISTTEFADIFGSEYKTTTLNINTELMKQLRHYIGKPGGKDRNDSRLVNIAIYMSIINEKQRRGLKEEDK